MWRKAVWICGLVVLISHEAFGNEPSMGQAFGQSVLSDSDSSIPIIDREVQQQLAELTAEVDQLRASADAARPDLSWRKGDYQITPYGIGWFNLAYDTQRTASGPFTQFVYSEDVEAEPAFSVNARASRFGVDVSGPTMFDARSSGKVEFDFFGTAQLENRAGILLRHAYGEFVGDGWRVIGGQTNDLIAPLNPNVLNYTVGWGAGNIGYRRAQLRFERELAWAPWFQTILQSSINQTIVTDFATDPVQGGEDAGWPTVMARLAFRGDPDESMGIVAAEIGFSGHIGEEQVDFATPPVQNNRRFTSWSFNMDAFLPLTSSFGMQGEFFTGQVLGTFQGGIVQGINPLLRRGIASTGGWAEIWVNLSEPLHAHAGFGIDDPSDSDLSPGNRSQNRFWFVNAVYDVTPLFSVGLEVSYWQTDFVDRSDGKAVRVETVMKYRF